MDVDIQVDMQSTMHTFWASYSLWNKPQIIFIFEEINLQEYSIWRKNLKEGINLQTQFEEKISKKEINLQAQFWREKKYSLLNFKVWRNKPPKLLNFEENNSKNIYFEENNPPKKTQL